MEFPATTHEELVDGIDSVECNSLTEGMFGDGLKKAKMFVWIDMTRTPELIQSQLNAGK